MKMPATNVSVPASRRHAIPFTAKALVIGVALACGSAQAATSTWTGGGNGANKDKWSKTTQNWSSAPAGNDVSIASPGNSSSVIYDLAGASSIQSITDSALPFLVSGGGVLTVTGNASFTGAANSVSVSAGGFAVGGTAGFGGGVSLTGGTLTLNGSSALASLTQSGGTFAGAGVVNISGLTSLSGGTLTRTGATNANGGLSISGPVTLGSNLTVTGDYQNTFGTGNTFNRAANVTGAGVINAAGVNPLSFQQLSINGAAATIGNATLALGNIHVGGAVSGTYAISDAAGASVNLRGAIQGSGVNSQLSGSGVDTGGSSWSATAGGSGATKSVTFTGATAGAVSSTVSIVNNFANTNSQTLTITGAAYNLAAGSATPAPVTLASQRVGGTVSQTLTISNTAAAGSFSEALNASIGGTSGAATGSGSVSLLAAGASNGSAISVGVGTATAGVKSGSVTLNYVSDGTGTSGLGQTAVGSQTINVSGKVYQAAAASTLAPVDFGIVHVGDTASRNIAVTNSATTAALNDTLQGSLGSATGAFTASGSMGGLAAQGTDSTSLKIALNTATAGAYSGTATASFASHNADMADLALAPQSLDLHGQVNNYARAAFDWTSGTGSLSGAGSAFTLDLGSIAFGDFAQAVLSLSNIGGIAAYTDWMSGSFDTAHAADFSLGNFTGFSALAGSAGLSGLTITLDGDTAGSFDEFLSLNYYGGNASGYQGMSQSVTLELKGIVESAPPAAPLQPEAVSAISEPNSGFLLLLGMGLASTSRLISANRRRRTGP